MENRRPSSFSLRPGSSYRSGSSWRRSESSWSRPESSWRDHESSWRQHGSSWRHPGSSSDGSGLQNQATSSRNQVFSRPELESHSEEFQREPARSIPSGDKTPERIGHRLNLYPVVGVPVALKDIANTSLHLDVAKAASKEFAKIVLHDPEKAEAELLSTDPSPRKAILSHPEWSNHAFAVKTEARRNGLIAIRILSDAFFNKCGYEWPETKCTAAEIAEWDRLKRERGTGSKAQCVFRNAPGLQREADLSKAELQLFMRLSSVSNPDVMLGRNAQNQAAHTLTVGLMAYQLQRAFRAFPDPDKELIMEKIFFWTCGKEIQVAIDDQDERFVTRDGIFDSELAFWRQEHGFSEIDSLFNLWVHLLPRTRGIQLICQYVQIDGEKDDVFIL